MIWTVLLACTGTEDLPPEGKQDAAECSDGFDNDQDGLVDCHDPDCESVRSDCEEVNQRDSDDREHTGDHTGDWPDHSRWDHSGWDSDCDEDHVSLDSISMSCDSVDWWYDVYSTGWMSSPDLWIAQTGVDEETAWNEGPHPFPAESYDYGANGCWDNFYLELGIVDSVNEVVYGSTSLYQCDANRKATLSWHLVIYDSGGTEADCAVWGEDPAAFESDCADWN